MPLPAQCHFRGKNLSRLAAHGKITNIMLGHHFGMNFYENVRGSKQINSMAAVLASSSFFSLDQEKAPDTGNEQ